METIGFIFGIFGLLAFCEVSTLQHRVKKLEKAFEEHFASAKGSPSYEERMALLKLIKSYVGKKVILEFQSEEFDFYEVRTSSGKGSCTILDADKDWVLVNLNYGKVNKDKLIRLKEISRIKGIEE